MRPDLTDGGVNHLPLVDLSCFLYLKEQNGYGSLIAILSALVS